MSKSSPFTIRRVLTAKLGMISEWVGRLYCSSALQLRLPTLGRCTVPMHPALAMSHSSQIKDAVSTPPKNSTQHPKQQCEGRHHNGRETEWQARSLYNRRHMAHNS
ncbi:barttin [Platysternon megacephalum]|uniref:Barttin n=1 Tax=Platysternon megacephalum TaxID=55544 RepID=A0A4D9EY74_9SAUR|nr:barttin [Platysternon megacephalum]